MVVVWQCAVFKPIAFFDTFKHHIDVTVWLFHFMKCQCICFASSMMGWMVTRIYLRILNKWNHRWKVELFDCWIWIQWNHSWTVFSNEDLMGKLVSPMATTEMAFSIQISSRTYLDDGILCDFLYASAICASICAVEFSNSQEAQVRLHINFQIIERFD